MFILSVYNFHSLQIVCTDLSAFTGVFKDLKSLISSASATDSNKDPLIDEKNGIIGTCNSTGLLIFKYTEAFYYKALVFFHIVTALLLLLLF